MALMLCHDARRSSRFAGGELVLLADQDRGLWDLAQIAEGRAVLERALALRAGPYVAAGGDRVAADSRRRSTGRRSSRSTASWCALTRSPVVALNRAVAIAEAGDVAGALAIADALRAGRLPLPALDPRRAAAAAGALGEARMRTARAGARRTEPERRFLAAASQRFPGFSRVALSRVPTVGT